MRLPTCRVVITGGPGAGKTTLLAELSTRGYATVTESAREIIAERLAAGLTPRPNPLDFARAILRRDAEKYAHQPADDGWVFFDRCALEAVAMIQEASRLDGADLTALLSPYTFHRSVFVLPPWRAIFTNDAERDQTFDDAVLVHDKVSSWYRSFGYTVHEVPRVSTSERADHVLSVLAGGDARESWRIGSVRG